jgi:lipid-A-disaccharide synthase
MTTLLVVAGEASGDLHGAEILSALKRLSPDIRIVGVGGSKMAPYLDTKLADVAELGVVGFFEVVRHLPKILKLEKCILRLAEVENADAALLIDYQSFNLRLAKKLRKARPFMRLHQYVCPQVWAWKSGRIPTLGATFDTLYCLFGFEPELFRGYPIEAICLGHPLVDLVVPEVDRDTFFSEAGLTPQKPLVALLPGSRRGELERLLPAILGMVERWEQGQGEEEGEGEVECEDNKQFHHLQWVLPVAPTLNVDEVRAAIGNLPITIVENRSYAARVYADAALVCSGTATLETAILGTPFAIMYRMNPLTLAIARRLIKIKHFGLANIVAAREVARELLQGEVSPAGLGRELLRLLDKTNATAIRQDLARFKGYLGEAGAAERVARHLIAAVIAGVLTNRHDTPSP